MPCSCTQYQPIELDRKSIERRIRESPAIRKRLEKIGENAELFLDLLRCPECSQLWQSGREWNFGNREYLFQVPPIEISEWQREAFRQPAAMMIYSARMQDFFDNASFEPRDIKCQAEKCLEQAIRFTVLCRYHHIEDLQERGVLPKEPVGRLFPPYHQE